MNQILQIFQKKLIYFSFFIVTFLFCFSPKSFAANYEISNFDAQITLNQDLSLTIKETIDANFLVAKHGIYRVIPYIYNHNGKTIKSKFKILGITNSQGLPVQFTIENFNQSKRLKIGDPNLTTTGSQKYIIEYQVDDVVLDYGQGPEIYWNVTGTEWDTTIKKASATVSSSFGPIIKTECYGCVSNFTPTQAKFNGQMGLTFVVQIDPKNSLKLPTKIEKTISSILDNIGYLMAFIPVTSMAFIWYKLGRDKKYLTENVFYQPEDKTTTSVPLFNRPHLPLVYSPIDSLTPAEVGTIIDEKVDTKDIVAEIVELARLKFLTIKKIETKGFLGTTKVDYQLTKLEKSLETLNPFQTSLLSKIFSTLNSIEISELKKDFYKNFPKLKNEIYDLLVSKINNYKLLKKDMSIDSLNFPELSTLSGKFKTKNDIKISELKNNFYKHLPDLKEKLYSQLELKKLTQGNINKVRAKWMILGFLLNFITIFIVITLFVQQTQNFGPVIILVLGFIASLIFGYNMPRKTALGYSLHRQAVGLKYYLEKGKWREEVMEKNLFLEEMLPLAITLGVVDRLAKDMKDLGVNPPSYMQGMAIHTFANDFSSFSSSVATNLTSSPSGNSSWSGGSGFGGGGGGGGFGGGGGGSW